MRAVGNDVPDPARVRRAQVTHTFAGGGYDAAAAVVVDVVVRDDDRPRVAVSSDALSVVEGEAARYGVWLAVVPSGTVTVAVTTSAPETDATVGPAVLTFTPADWSEAQTVTVSTVADAVRGARTVAVSHQASGGVYAGAPARAVVVTVTEAPGVTVAPRALSVVEGEAATYTVALHAAPASGTVTVEVSSGDDAVATVAPEALTFTAGDWEVARTVTVSTVAEAALGERTVQVGHVLAAGAQSGYAAVTVPAVGVTVGDAPGMTFAPASVTVVEGATATYTVRLNTRPAREVSLRLRPPGFVAVSPPTMKFTRATWSVARTVTVTGKDDRTIVGPSGVIVHEEEAGGYVGDVSLAVAMTNTDVAGARVTSNVPVVLTEGGSPGTYLVELTAAPSDDVVVVPSSETPGVVTPLGVLTFTPVNWDLTQRLTVRAVDDAIDNPLDEDGHDRRAGRVSHEFTGGGYDAVTLTVAVTVTDNDVVGVRLLSAGGLTVSEADDASTPGVDEREATYAVVLTSEPAAAVTVTPAADESGAVRVSDGVLTFTAQDWNVARTVTVTGVDDAVVNPPGGRTAKVSHAVAGPGSGYESVSAPSAWVVVLDDEAAPAPGLVLSDTTLAVTEGGTGAYTVALATQPSATVTVAVTGEGSEVSVDRASLTFTGADWSTAQTVTVSAGEDDNTVSETVTLTHTPSGGDYDSVSARTVVVTTTDNDTADLEPAFAPDASIADRTYTQGTSIGTLSLPEATGGDLPLTYTLEGPGGAALPAGLTFNATARTLTGAPSAVQSATTYTYTATDADETAPDSVSLAFTIEVTALVGTAKTTTVSGVEVQNALAAGSLRLSVDGSKLRVTVEGGANDGAWVVLPSGARVVVDEVASNSPSRTTTPPGYEARGPDDALLDVAVTGLGVGEAAELCVPFDGAGKAALFRWDGSAWERVGDATTSRPVCGTKSGSFSPFAVFGASDPALVLSKSSLPVVEGGTGTYTVRLATPPTAPVTVAVTGAGSGVSVDRASLTFTDADWSTAQTVTVSAGEDANTGAETVTLTHTPSGGDYSGVSAKTVRVTTTDTDTAGLVLSESALAVTEGGTGAYTVRLAPQPPPTVTVAVTGAGTSCERGQVVAHRHRRGLEHVADVDGHGGRGRQRGVGVGDADAHALGWGLRLGERQDGRGDDHRQRHGGGGGERRHAVGDGGWQRGVHGEACDAALGDGDGGDRGRGQWGHGGQVVADVHRCGLEHGAVGDGDGGRGRQRSVGVA